MSIEFLDTIDSTNLYFKRKSESNELNKGDVVVAQIQDGGRGRLGRSFYSPLGGIYLTISYGYKNDYDASYLSLMPSAALALSKLIKQGLGKETYIKWPNDILYNGKKVVGILAERTTKGDLILGVGINYDINFDNTPLKDIAISLYSNSTPKLSKLDFTLKVISCLLHLKTFEKAPELVKEYNKLCLNIDKFITVKTINGNIIGKGIALGIDKTGAMNIKNNLNKIQKISSGEITLH